MATEDTELGQRLAAAAPPAGERSAVPRLDVFHLLPEDQERLARALNG